MQMNDRTSHTTNNLAQKCLDYLASGPPAHMEDYVPESITEIIIAHGAQQEKLDEELKEIGQILLIETDDFSDISDPQIRDYMEQGAKLLQAIMASQ